MVVEALRAVIFALVLAVKGIAALRRSAKTPAWRAAKAQMRHQAQRDEFLGSDGK